MKYQELAKISDTKMKKLLTEQLSDNPGLRRKELLEHCILSMPFSPEEIANRSTGSIVVHAMSRLGMQLSELIANGDISESSSGELTAQNGTGVIVLSDSAVDFLLEILRDDKPMLKRDIFSLAERRFCTDLTPSRDDDNELHALLGKILARLEKQHIVVRTDKGYLLPPRSSYPNTQLGVYLHQASAGEDLFTCFINAIHIKGGEWFELYAVQLIEKYYKRCHYTVTNAFVTGGSNDGGIDGVIETVDEIGFRERTLMQMKNKLSVIPQKDVREFYGAVCAEKGSRGLFVTISSFHKEAEILINKVDNLMGITGSKLFEMAKLVGYGVKKEKGRYVLDDQLFLEN